MEVALIAQRKPRVGFWDPLWIALGWKLTAHVEHPRHEPPAPADLSQSQRITELEKEQQGLKANLALTTQLLTQYKASLDRSDRAIESLELQLRTQQELLFNLIRNFNKDLSAQAEKFKSDLESHEQKTKANDEERESQITYLFNKLFALEASYRMEKRAPGMDSSSNLPTAQPPDQHQRTRSQDQIIKDGTQVDTDVQIRSPPNLTTLLDQQQTTIYAIIDGDGHIFDASLLKRGAQGGIEAAKLLMDTLTAYYQQNFLDIPSAAFSSSSSDFQLRVNIFLNSRGLQHALASKEICTTTQYDNFMAGFTQSNPKILICDVRSGKDAADMKVREHLLDYARNPTVTKIFFGGCHDTGYTTTLNTLLNENLLYKVILLQGYKHVHKKISSFSLPLLSIPGLFMEERLPRNPPKSSTPPEEVEDKAASQKASGNSTDEGKQRKTLPVATMTIQPSPPPSLPPPTPSTPAKVLGSIKNENKSSATIISSPLSRPANLSQTNETNSGLMGITVKGLDLSDETGDSKRRRKRSGRRRDSSSSDDRPAMPNLLFQRMKLVNRPKVSFIFRSWILSINSFVSAVLIYHCITQGAPSPCYYFYVGNKCPAGEKCKLGHFYLLKPEELKHLKNEGAKRPCLAVQKNLPCVLGWECPMAHKCPHGPECKQYAQQGRGRCQFKGENMHK